MMDRLTREEAQRRAEQVSDVSYHIDLEFEAGAKSFRGDTTVSFRHAGGDTFLELLGGQIERLQVNGVIREPDWDGGRLRLPGALLGEENEVRVVYERLYDRTGEGIHHFVDPEDGAEYIYTQFEPYSAHRVFPCFDQPDLKARYSVSVTAPAEWEVVSAGREIDRAPLGDGHVRRVFAETVPFSTYLLAVCAGPFHHVHDEHAGIPLGLYCRQSLAEHLDPDNLFATTKASLDFFEEFFDQPYPFGKYDQLFVPEFNWGGMENVAAVTYTDSVVFRDPPTADQLFRRDEYFTHELAHMWFGDLVTMRWWSDLWLNESFASYMGYLALDRIGREGVWQDFLNRMKLWAYREDQLPTTHPIADEVASTDETFLNFDGISYGKGASVLKQLVRAIGEDAFRRGMQAYFKRHAYGNASLADFLAALQEGSGTDLVHWAARWLRTASLNSISADWEADDAGRVARFELVQHAPEGHPVLRPHALDVGLVDPSGQVTVVPAEIEKVRTRIPLAEGGPAPAFVFPNVGDHGFFKIELGYPSLRWARHHLGKLGDDMLRQQVWATLWEMVRDARFSSIDYLELVRSSLPEEADARAVRLVAGTVGGAVGRYVPDRLVDEEAHAFVETADAAFRAAEPGDPMVTWVRSLLGLVAGERDARLAAAIVDDPPEGLTVDQEMRWSVATAWSSLGLEGAAERVAAERRRDRSDRGERAELTASVARPDLAVKEETWERLHGSGYPSLHLAMAAARGFWRRSQREMLDPFVPRFFEGLPDVFDRWEFEAARAYWGNLFPRHRVDEDVQARVRSLLERDDLTAPLRRLLREADDDLGRALRCRAFAEAGLLPVPG
ncbi:MAG TPA: aminopeptidase N [Acidimicrobiia bacterium]|nr:aminopeptidase N [Acidimicrobiia bacterium]